MTRCSRWVWPLFCAAAVSACASSAPSRADVVADMTTEAVPVRYGSLAEEAEVLTGRVGLWCSSGDDAFVRDQLVVVRDQWVGLAPFWFGPAMDRRSRFLIEPAVRSDDIDDLLASDEIIDANGLRERFGADQRGLQALAVLLDGNPAERRCRYATAIAELVAEEVRFLADDWAAFGPERGADVVAANEALESIVNESLFALDAMARQPGPTDAVKLEGVRWALIGDETETASGLSNLLDDIVVAQLTAEFDSARSLDADALFDLDRTIATNVVSSLGLSVQFSDADGDG